MGCRKSWRKVHDCKVLGANQGKFTDLRRLVVTSPGRSEMDWLDLENLPLAGAVV